MGSPSDCVRVVSGSWWDDVTIILGSCWHHFEVMLGSYWDQIGVMMGSSWEHVGVFILGSFWGHNGVILGSVWGHVGSSWDHFGVMLTSYWDHIGVMLGSFWHHAGTNEMHPKCCGADFGSRIKISGNLLGQNDPNLVRLVSGCKMGAGGRGRSPYDNLLSCLWNYALYRWDQLGHGGWCTGWQRSASYMCRPLTVPSLCNLYTRASVF